MGFRCANDRSKSFNEWIKFFNEKAPRQPFCSISKKYRIPVVPIFIEGLMALSLNDR